MGEGRQCHDHAKRTHLIQEEFATRAHDLASKEPSSGSDPARHLFGMILLD